MSDFAFWRASTCTIGMLSHFALAPSVPAANGGEAIITGVMLPRWIIGMGVSAALICAIPCVSGQIIEEREYRGKTITCMLSGLRGWGSPCGTDGNYVYIFVGSVLSVTEISETERDLQLSPHEVFLGDNASRVEVTTNQGACLPELLPGDEWLFYLYRDEKTKELILSYGCPSAPIAEAQPSIIKLRRLAAMTDSGIITGFVQTSVRFDHDGVKGTEYVDVPNHKLIAKRTSDGTEYSTLTDADGKYEFEPLPAGSYHLTANTAAGLWAEDGPTTVHPRGCTSYEFELQADGRISGHIKSVDGRPFKIHPWVDITSEDGSHSKSAYVDDHGYFEARGLEPDRYLVGVGIQAQSDTPEWRSRIYYPGVGTKEKATVIQLGRAEKRTNIDLKLRNSASP